MTLITERPADRVANDRVLIKEAQTSTPERVPGARADERQSYSASAELD